MEKYNASIANNDKIELIQVSLEGEDAGLKWAMSHTFPWPVIQQKKIDSAKVGKNNYSRRGVPTYILVDREGKEVTRSTTEIWNKIKTL